MAFADLVVVLSVLLALMGSLLNLRWVRVGYAVFLVGVMTLFVKAVLILFRLSGSFGVTAVQAVFIASLCVVWATATTHVLASGKSREFKLFFAVGVPLFYVLVLLAILSASGTLHAVLVDACVITLIAIIVASRGHRPHGLGRFVAAVLLPASLLIHTSSVVGVELSASGLKVIVPLLGYAALAAIVPVHPWFLRVVTERDDVLTITAAVSVVYLGYFGMTLRLSGVASDVWLWALGMLGLVTLFYASSHAFTRRDLGGRIAYYVSTTTGFLLFFSSALALHRSSLTLPVAVLLGAGSVMFVPAVLPSHARQSGSGAGSTLTSTLSSMLVLLLVSSTFPSLNLVGRALLAVVFLGLQPPIAASVLALLVLSVGLASATVAGSLRFKVMEPRTAFTLPLLMNALLTLTLFYCALTWLLNSLTLSATQLVMWLILMGLTSGFSAWLVAWHEALGIFLERTFKRFPMALAGLEREFRYVAARVVGSLEVIETEEKFLATLSLLILLAAIVTTVFLGGVAP